ncbi:unnamed protein product [Aspergillus oryzae]|uniref:Unnamed protein product n=1 Tax=Aspergillus oryzae TaxID=5062 RepID=A0AAN4YB35_ASPOZ|nr:unnamed protein product [Aspergillus oryzae]
MDEKQDITTQNEKANGADEKLLTELENPQKIQKIVREGILLAGGGAAILLQVAMPGVGKGVDEHSNFSYRPLDRLRTTMTYVYCMAFGTPEEKKIIIEMVHKAHSVVRGPDYSADDPHLQVWVAATLYAVGIDLYEQVFGRMDEATAEAIYREYAVLAVSLRVQPEMWPPTREAFWIYWDEQINKLQHQITPQAKNVCKDLLFNKQVPFVIRISMPLVRLMTADLLPDRFREEYGLKTTQHLFTFTFTIFIRPGDYLDFDRCGSELNGPRGPVIGVDIGRSDATLLSMAVHVRDVAKMVEVIAHSAQELAGKTSVDLTTPGNVSFFFCPFLTLNGLAILPQEDVTYLASKGSLSVPDWSTINEFARQYFLQIHPCLPVLDEAGFWPENDAFAKAQGSVPLAHHTSAHDPQASSIWLMRAIQNAMIVGCGPGPGDQGINLSLMKRLWWSMVLRDRVLSIGLRRRPQITSVEFNMGANWLTEEDFAEEIVSSRVYDPQVKILLFQVLQEQCKLAVLLTDMVALVFSSQGVSSPSLSLAEFQAVLAAIRRIKRYLTKWEDVSIVLPSTSHETVTFFTHLTWILAYTAVPLVLTAIDVKLSPTPAEMTIRKRRLERLGEIVRHSRMLYDVADYVAAGTNHILQLAYITTQEAFLRCSTNAIGSSQMEIESSSGGMSLDASVFNAKRVTNWYDAFLSSPRAYLRISVSLDYSLATGRLPYDNALPLLVRQTPWAKKQQRLPWTIGLDTDDSAVYPDAPRNGRVTEDISSISQISTIPEEQPVDIPEDDDTESQGDARFPFIAAIGESIREETLNLAGSSSPEEGSTGDDAINLNFFEFGSQQLDDILEMETEHTLDADQSQHLGMGASRSGKERADDVGFGHGGFQSIYTSLLRDTVA